MGCGAQARDRIVMQETVEIPRHILRQLLYQSAETVPGTSVIECRLCRGSGATRETVRHYADCYFSETQRSIW
jgi:hypothetical protein